MINLKHSYYIIIGLFAVWNIFVFLLYGFDKFASKRGMWRISEKMLLTSAFLMGGVGAFLGMEFFRHKTKHRTFKALVPMMCALNIAVITYFYKSI